MLGKRIDNRRPSIADTTKCHWIEKKVKFAINMPRLVFSCFTFPRFSLVYEIQQFNDKRLFSFTINVRFVVRRKFTQLTKMNSDFIIK